MTTRIGHVLDEPGELWKQHRVVSQPTMIFIDGRHREAHRAVSSMSREDLLETMQQLASGTLAT